MATSPESLLISAVLKAGNLHVAIGDRVTPDMFVAYPEEWEWLMDYHQQYRRTPSVRAFKNEFPSFTLYKTDDTEFYCTKVRERHAKRIMVTAMDDSAKLLAQGNIDKAMRLLKEAVVGTAAKIDKNNDSDILTSYDDIMKETEAVFARVQERGSAGIPTSFGTWDAYTGGCKGGELIIVGARLGGGKSWSLLKMANAAVGVDYRCQYDALEMTRGQVHGRMMDLLAGGKGFSSFRSLDLLQGKSFNMAEYRKFLHDTKVNAKGALFVSDRNNGRLTKLTIEAQIQKNNPDIVFVDHIGLMDRNAAGDWAAMGQLSSDLKALAMDYHIPVVAAAQLNRAEGIGKDPAGTEAIAQSDRIGQDADQIVTMAVQSESVIKMKLVKNRLGKSSPVWHCAFNPGAGIFREVTKKEAEKLMEIDADLRDAAAAGE
jgi:replicative DNA helicase